jgi:hypothetical protein
MISCLRECRGVGINTELKSVLEEPRTIVRDLRSVAATFDPSRVFWLALPTDGRWRSFIVFDSLEGARIFKGLNRMVTRVELVPCDSFPEAHALLSD